MNSFQLNKYAGAFLASCLFLMVLGQVGRIVVHADKPEKDVFAPVEDTAVAAAAAGPAAATIEPIEPLLAKANVANGEASFNKRCATCHTVAKGGPNKVGPNLFGVVGNHGAHLEGFAYSEAMKARHDKPWTFEDTSHFIYKPSAFVKGTKMAFAGITNTQERADLIAYLNTQSDKPLPLPPEGAPAAAPSGDAAPQPAQGGVPAASQPQPEK